MTDWLQTGSYTQALQGINGLFQQRAQRQAGQRLRQRDFEGASGALLDAGDVSGGLALQNAGRQQQQADATRQWDFTVKAVNALEGVAGQGGDVVAAFDNLVPIFRQMGTDDAQISQLRQSLAANPQQFLQSVKATIPVEYQFRDGGAGDVVRGDPRTGKVELAYDAPDRPTYLPGVGFLLPPGSGGSVSPTPNGNQPLTGPANISSAPLYSPSSMVGITAQAESGNRERDAQGRLITSPAGAQGRMQVMPTTNTDPGYGVTPARDNSDAERTRVGEDYLAAMMREYGGDPAKAWAAYNWGPGNLNRALEQYGGDWLRYAPAETQNYVANNLRQLNGSGGTPQIEQGDTTEQDSTIDLGGGFRVQPVQTEADRRAARSEQRANAAERRAQASFERQNAPVSTLSATEVSSLGLPEGTVAQRRADGSINVVSRGGSERYTEGQRQAAGFAYRLQNAAGSLDRLASSGTARPSAAILAFGDGRIRENALNSTDRRWLQAAREWLAPVLRKDTGAAVGPGELVTYMGIYLPSPTDDAATLAQKAQARRTAEQALRAQAGGAYDEMFPQSRQQPQGRRRTNAPGLPFDIAPGQLQTRQRLLQSGASPSAPVGSERNPRYMNPQDPNASWANARSGDYLVRPDGRLVRKP